MTPLDPSAQSSERIEPLEGPQSVGTDDTATVRVALGVSYDGSGFHGFASQPGLRTVAGTLTDALSALIDHEVTCVCAGRTDIGVHATGQIVHADLDAQVLARRFAPSLDAGTKLEALRQALGSKVGSGISLWHAGITSGEFDARRSALARRYRYQIDVDERSRPLRRHLAWQLDRPLELSVLRIATDVLLGEHDFTAFCRRPQDKPLASLTRRVIDAGWRQPSAGRYEFEIEANAFCHQMVRSIVGMLVAAGTAKIRPSDVKEALQRGDRSEMAPPAPAHGLCLVKVRYPPRFEIPFSS